MQDFFFTASHARDLAHHVMDVARDSYIREGEFPPTAWMLCANDEGLGVALVPLEGTPDDQIGNMRHASELLGALYVVFGTTAITDGQKVLFVALQGTGVNEAYIANIDGRKIADFEASDGFEENFSSRLGEN
jgi:hypothetical protein